MDIRNIPNEYKNIAVVGISRNQNKTGRPIADYLVDNDFNVAGVNPAAPFDAEKIKVYKNILR
ncbi:MAG: CoA-binding protein [Ignavibacteria bacterium]|jgi:predicted CoA-binding protein